MTTNVATSPDTIAREFADALRNESGIDQLWVRPYYDRLELWVILKPVEDDTERRVAEAFMSLVERYPIASLRPRFLHPLDFIPGIDLAAEVPSGARQIALHD